MLQQSLDAHHLLPKNAPDAWQALGGIIGGVKSRVVSILEEALDRR